MRDFLCNGKRRLSEIEQEIFRLHPEAVQNRGGSRAVCGRGCDLLLAVTDANL